MTFRIPVGKHRAWPLKFGLWWRKNSFAWMVKFDESCRYDLGNDDQFDTNKLCGLAYLRGWHHERPDGRRWMLGLLPWLHHNDSARFGWRYWPDKGWIELIAYCYVDKRVVIQHIAFCEIGKEYRLRLQVLAAAYYFDVYEPDQIKAAGVVTVERFHEKRLKYRLGLYFGGNQSSPHEITIELSKL